MLKEGPHYFKIFLKHGDDKVIWCTNGGRDECIFPLKYNYKNSFSWPTDDIVHQPLQNTLEGERLCLSTQPIKGNMPENKDYGSLNDFQICSECSGKTKLYYVILLKIHYGS